MSLAARSRLAAVAVLVGVLLVVVPSVVRPVGAAPAQTPPLVPIETLLPVLEPLQPVLEVISPIVWPLCANAVLVSVLPGALGIEVPPELSTVTGPLLVLCGAVPIPGTNQRVCALDAQAQAVLAELTKPVLGSGPPVEVAPTKWVTGLLDNIVDLIALPGIPLGSTVAATLQCIDPPPDTTTTVPAADPGVSPPTSPPTEVPPAPVFDLPTFEELQTLPPLELAPVASPAAPSPPTEPVVRLIDQPRFRYPVVMGLPLVFLALLVFFGRTLTRPIGAPHGGDR